MVVANIVTELTDWLDEVSRNWWFLLIIFAIALLDSVIPVVPSETAVILGGVAAGLGTADYNVVLVIVAGALGAFSGDNIAYTIGDHFSGRIHRYADGRPKFAARIDWARRQIRRRGGPLLVTARFIPGGRTALTLTSGITNQPHPWFARWVGLAAVIWATYGAVLGALFGNRFKDSHTTAFLVAFGTALTITLLIEVVRHLRDRNRDGIPDDTAATNAATTLEAETAGARAGEPDPAPLAE